MRKKIKQEKLSLKNDFPCCPSGVGRRSSRQAKNRIVDQVLTIAASSDESRSNGDECLNCDNNSSIPEDGGSCTGKLIEFVFILISY